jgi:PAS domain S-box-containing protein
LVWSYTRPFSSGQVITTEFDFSVGFWIHAAYSYLLLLIGTILLASMAFRSPSLYRKQSIAVLIGVLVPWAGNMIYLLDLGPVSHLDLTPFAFTITGITLTWALFRYQLLDVMPVAHNALFENMNEGVIIRDVQNRIVDLNPAAQRILRCTASEAVGRTVAQVMPIQQVPLLEGHQEVREAHEEVKFGDESAQRDYHLKLTSLQDQSGRYTGSLIVLRDITEDKLKARLDYLAYHDSLTGLPNRRLFMDRLRQALRRTKRRSGLWIWTTSRS